MNTGIQKFADLNLNSANHAATANETDSLRQILAMFKLSPGWRDLYNTQARLTTKASTRFDILAISKIDLIERRLDRLGDLVESLAVQASASSQTRSVEHSNGQQSNTGIAPDHGRDSSVSMHQNYTLAATSDATDKASVIKTQSSSSLSAHSSFAVRFLHDVVDSKPERDASGEVACLLSTISQMVDAFNAQSLSPSSLFPYAREKQSSNGAECAMPPIEVAVKILQKAQATDHIDLQILTECFVLFLGPQTLSELCLKVYFSQGYSDAEFIILNAVLYLFGAWLRAMQKQPVTSIDDEDGLLVSTCRANLETALSRLTLYMQPSHEMVFALVLGVIYAIDNAKGTLASILVVAASQAARSLGYHTRSVGADALTGQPNNKGLLFWTVYYLEKTLSLRNGQSSTISDRSVTVPMPSAQVDTSPNSYLTAYSGQMVSVARLAGRIYEELYCPGSLALPVDTRARRATALAQELRELSAAFRSTMESWLQSAPVDQVQTNKSTAMSDEVLRLSMLTLIYRATPAPAGSLSTFNEECLSTARAALEHHQSFILEFGASDTVLLSGHITWSILFVPFVPFIVLFCHAIETGAVEDLNQMRAFVTSIESACPNSPAIAKHHRLFQVFYTVAQRYRDLMVIPEPAGLQGEQQRLRMEVDAQLSAFGLQTQLASAPYPAQSGNRGPPLPDLDIRLQESSSSLQGADVPDGFNLGDWFSFSQNIVGLLDRDELPF
ncbi:fungal specific transcription factor domain-containing protein [Aspergillus mulundensis]|uniref:Xylanolytic transcriptional activator regulatory domain-containing protein n=1 Tax=Aspergillus mulundensis TaxID=1810919 RepID=A0A3D8RA39_9EURO|nr:hypothetical protein DSM5745_08430 [Aspergillus mulundensis]RDW70919.1 hypothetical protein DSM5745_08430 [Aspergillus mulundensis]